MYSTSTNREGPRSAGGLTSKCRFLKHSVRNIEFTTTTKTHKVLAEIIVVLPVREHGFSHYTPDQFGFPVSTFLQGIGNISCSLDIGSPLAVPIEGIWSRSHC
jgi:hypothetical protein